MITIKNARVMNWAAALRGMRNPLSSWSRADSEIKYDETGECVHIGENDYKLCKSLIKSGKDHRKFVRMITVSFDVIAPMYWWKEVDTYKIGTTANSTSTMHKIHSKEFSISDFSTEHLNGDEYGVYENSIEALNLIIGVLNFYRRKFIKTKDKQYWWQMIQLLPSSYNQTRTITLNYEVLANMYHSRHNHKLDEWVKFCEWIEDCLPYSEFITGKFEVD